MSKGATRFSFRAPGFDSLGWQGWKYMDMVSWEEIPLEVPLLQVKGSAALYLLSRDWLGDAQEMQVEPMGPREEIQLIGQGHRISEFPELGQSMRWRLVADGRNRLVGSDRATYGGLCRLIASSGGSDGGSLVTNGELELDASLAAAPGRDFELPGFHCIG